MENVKFKGERRKDFEAQIKLERKDQDEAVRPVQEGVFGEGRDGQLH